MVDYSILTFRPMIKHTRGVSSTPCMLFKMEKNYPLCDMFESFSFIFLESPLPVIWSELDFNKFPDACFINTIATKQIKKKLNRFFSNTINMHLIHPLFISIYYIYYSVKSLFYKCFYGISAMQVLYIFYLTMSSKYERVYK
jgi:hypothetical protein